MKKVKLSNGKEVEVQKLTVRMMRDAMKRDNEIDQTVSMVSQTTGLGESEIDDLPIEDFMMLQKELESFLFVTGAAVPKTR